MGKFHIGGLVYFFVWFWSSGNSISTSRSHCMALSTVMQSSIRATKEIDTLQAGVKEYVATMALGATTPSFDLETEIDATYPTGHITRTLVEETLKRFTGSIVQCSVMSVVRLKLVSVAVGEGITTEGREGRRLRSRRQTIRVMRSS